MTERERNMHKSLLLTAVLATLALPIQSYAEDTVAAAPVADWTFPGTAGVVSDYIFRGQSQSWGKASIQASIEADHKSGFYAGLALASVSSKWLPGATIENDWYAGFRNKIGSTDIGYDVGGIYYAYQGGNWDKSAFPNTNKKTLNTFEVYGALSYQWLTVKAGTTLTDYFGWTNNNSGIGGGFNGDLSAGVKPGGSTKGSYYYEADAAYEILPTWTASGQLGRQTVADSTGLDLTYWKAGVTKAFVSGWNVSAFYSGTNEPNAYKDFLSLANMTDKSNIAKDTVFVSIVKNF